MSYPDAAMVAKETARRHIAELIEKYEGERDRQQSEANVRANYVDWLFLHLGWDVWRNDPEHKTAYQREAYVRGAGYVDVGLEIRGEPVLFLEAKRFGRIPLSSDRTLEGTGDRTLEEKQAFRYARGRKIPYTILTNFERLHLFNADHERLILAFDSPQQYLERFEDLWRLSPGEVERGSLPWWEAQLAKRDVDLEFLAALRRWRLLLANAIYQHNAANPALQEDGAFDFLRLMEAVQRILDRLILVRYGDDKEVLLAHDLLEKMVAEYQGRGAYARPDHLMRAFIDLSQMMDQHHNTTLFAPGHVCEQLTLPNEVLAQVIEEMNRISFRKFTSDILGNTYESYLGTKLVLRNGQIEDEERRDIRKGRGIYYTPRWVVEYIVDNTLGRRLKELEEEHGLHAIEQVRGLAVLDPACGSGSFLIYAYQVLADFYRRMNDAIEKERIRLMAELQTPQMSYFLEQFTKLPQPVMDYPQVILKEHLFGVDLDPEAAEIAAVNLTMQAFADSRQKKLPLILNENIKVGNSLISGGESELRPYFGDAWREKRPFTWEREFPDIMARSALSRRAEPGEAPSQGGGFDVVIGNPPYVRVDSLPEDDKRFYKDKFISAVGKYDAYYLFLELGLKLVREGGALAFIVPNRFCTNTTGEDLRRLLLSPGHQVEVTSVSRLPVFREAANYPVITVVRKHGAKPRTLAFVDPGDVSQLPTTAPSYQLSEDEIVSLPRVIMPINVTYAQLAVALRLSMLATPAGKLLEIQEGLRIPRAYETQKDAHFQQVPIIKQFQFSRYSSIKEGSFLTQKDLESLFSQSAKRIVNSRKTKLVFAEDALRVEATLDTSKGLCQGGAYFATLLGDEPYSPFYLLGLFNSRLLTFHFKSLYSAIHMGGGFLRFRTEYLQELPIRRIDFANPEEKAMHDRLVALVERMLALHQRKADPSLPQSEREDLEREIARTDREIDNLVYDLYGLTEAERRMVEGE